MIDEKLPPNFRNPKYLLWAGEQAPHQLSITYTSGKIPTEYQSLELKAEPDNPFTAEELLVDDVKVISIQTNWAGRV